MVIYLVYNLKMNVSLSPISSDTVYINKFVYNLLNFSSLYLGYYHCSCHENIIEANSETYFFHVI